MRSKCATSLPDKVNPINGRPAHPIASSDLSCAAPAATSPTTASTAIRRRSHRIRLPLIPPQSVQRA